MITIDKERDAAIVRLFNQGLPMRQIAEQIGCHESTVKNARRRAGLPPRVLNPRLNKEQVTMISKLLDDGWSMREISRTYGHKYATIKRYFPDAGWSKDQTAELSSMLQRALHAERKKAQR
jgi:DNA-binding NarL/FixJ family response regulator